jgi:hypothetical protein
MVEATHNTLYRRYLEMALACYNCFAPTTKSPFFCEMTPIHQIFVKDLILNASDVYFDEFSAKYCGKVD